MTDTPSGRDGRTPHVELPLDASEADALEQLRPLVDDDDPIPPAELRTTDADPVDVLDQHVTIPVDDEEAWPT